MEAELAVLYKMFFAYDVTDDDVRAQVQGWADANGITLQQAVEAIRNAVVPIGEPPRPVAPPGFWDWFAKKFIELAMRPE
jgi:hypothetical protein